MTTPAPKTIEEEYFKILEALGWTREQIISRLEHEMELHGWTTIPLQEIIKIIRGRASDTEIAARFTESAAAMLQLVKTGKGKVSKSPLDLA